MGGRRVMLAARRPIGRGTATLVVAEIGQNHNGELALAEELIDAAAWAGADAVKVVKRDLAAELSAEARRRQYHGPHAFGSTYGEHRRRLELSADDHARLARRARGHGLLFIATVCDRPSVEVVEPLAPDALKIASRDLTNLPLVADLASRGRPLLVSTGMSGFDEIDAAVAVVRARGAPHVLLHCTSLYPTPPSEAHLRSIPALARRYRVPIGFSDHTTGTHLALAAVALGAAVVEKHLTLDRRMKGTDHACSSQPEELRQMIEQIREVETALGRSDKPLAASIAPVRIKLGKSLVARRDLPVGTQLDEAMLDLKCPGDGIGWLQRDRVLGRRLRRSVRADEKLSIDDLE